MNGSDVEEKQMWRGEGEVKVKSEWAAAKRSSSVCRFGLGI